MVIADVPCSGLGIIGRKNDIKYRINDESIKELIILQDKIIENAASYVKKGGVLLYSTCTINPEENDDRIEKLLKNRDDFKLIKKRHFLQGIDR